jgi:Ni/Co efflux regulator RcnB
VKKIIIAINGLLLLSGLLVFTSLTPSTASASVLPQNDNKMTMSGKHNNKRRHHRRWRSWRRHHRMHHNGNKNM